MNTIRRADAGETLAEILVATALLGIAVVGIVGALGSSSLLSDFHRKDGVADSELRSFAETVKKLPYKKCSSGTPPDYETLANFTPPTGYTADVVSVAFWTGADPADASATASFASSCPAIDKGLQALVLKIVSPEGRAEETTTLLKRRE